MKQNMSWLFYKDYYSGRDLDNINYKQKSKSITAKKLSDYTIPYLPDIENKKSFQLQTIYPGLLIGSGYQHDFSHNDAFKIGFYFDYTTGLPLIPGSSVKGVLRSAFEKANGGYVRELLEEIKQKNEKDESLADDEKLTDDKIRKLLNDKIEVENYKGKLSLLEAHIFHGVYKVKEKYKDKDGKEKEKIVIKNLSPYETDIFFDAFPIHTNNEDGKFLANDYITPHDNPLKNPNPIQFLKILPQVTFQFNFRLHYFKDEDNKTLLSAENKKELFKQILKDLGIGAKTNVGYGQFNEDPETAKKEKLAKEKAAEEELKKLKEIERKQKLKEIEKEKKEIEKRIKEKGISSLIGNITDYGVLRENIKKYKEIIKLTETDLFDEKDQATLLQELNKIIKKKKRKFREKLFDKIKNEAKNWLNEDNINKLSL